MIANALTAKTIAEGENKRPADAHSRKKYYEEQNERKKNVMLSTNNGGGNEIFDVKWKVTKKSILHVKNTIGQDAAT